MNKRLLVPFALLSLFYFLDTGTVGVRAKINDSANRPANPDTLRYLAGSDDQSASSAKYTAANQDT
jgi:hypothetical protein